MPESREQKLLSPAWGHLHKTPISRGEGLYVYDTAGKRFMDFTSGIGVTATGHCHPAVVKAIQEQAAHLVFGRADVPQSNAAGLPTEPPGLADGITRGSEIGS